MKYFARLLFALATRINPDVVIPTWPTIETKTVDGKRILSFHIQTAHITPHQVNALEELWWGAMKP